MFLKVLLVYKMYKRLFNNLSMAVLVVSKRVLGGDDGVMITIAQVNQHALELLKLGEYLPENTELSQFFPIVDTELRFGMVTCAESAVVYDSYDDVDYKIVVQALQNGSYTLEIYPGKAEEDNQQNNRQLIQSLKHEILKLISKEAFQMRENEYLSRLLNCLPAIVAIKDSNFRYRYVNNSFANVVGRFPKDIIGKTDYDLFSSEHANRYREKDKLIIEQNVTVSEEEQFIDHNGVLHDLYTKKIPVVDNNGNISIQLLSSDITEIKALQKELLHIKAQYEEVADLSKYVVWVMDVDFSHSFISPSIKQFQGYEAEEFLHIDLSQSLTESSMAKAVEIRTNILKMHENQEFEKLRDVCEINLDYYHKDGHIVKGKVLFKAILDDNNNLIGIHGSTIQIDE